jgi:hypothetical protein
LRASSAVAARAFSRSSASNCWSIASIFNFRRKIRQFAQ